MSCCNSKIFIDTDSEDFVVIEYESPDSELSFQQKQDMLKFESGKDLSFQSQEENLYK